MATRAHIIGWGKYVPQRVMTNDDLAQMVSTSDEWIRTRTGISQRRIAGEGETTASMSILAAHRALEVANLSPTQLDLIIVATSTPDHLFPSTACLVQDALGATHAAAFDLLAACTGFVYGLSIAASMIETGGYRNVLIIGAETLSRIVDWSDRATCVLFGDGAGAVILQANGANGGILSNVLGADGSGSDVLCLSNNGGPGPPPCQTAPPEMHFLRMKGREVFRFAVRAVPDATRRVLAQAGLALADLDLLIPHQANQRIIQSSAKALGIANEAVFSNVEQYGNTSAASIPIALCEAVDEGHIQADDLVVLVGFGGGLTWAASAVRWSAPLPSAPPPRWKRAMYQMLYRYAALRSALRRFLRWLAALLTRE
jgi:3-oxoacyl-[acyl-carrier-protein] synthase-3